MTDEIVKQLITRLIFDAGDALTRGEEFNKLVAKIRAELRSLMDQGLSLQSAWKGLFANEFTAPIEAAKSKIAELKKSLADLKTELAGFGGEAARQQIVETKGADPRYARAVAVPQEIQAVNEQLKEQKALLAELTRDQKIYGQAGTAAQNQIKQAEMAASAQIKQDKRSEISIMNEYIQATKSGYKIMSTEAQAYGKWIQQIKAEIISLSKQQSVSFQQAAQQLAAKGGTTTQDLNVALKELQPTTQGTTSAFSGLASVATKLFGFVFAVLGISSITSIVNGLQQAAKAGEPVIRLIFYLPSAKTK